MRACRRSERACRGEFLPDGCPSFRAEHSRNGRRNQKRRHDRRLIERCDAGIDYKGIDALGMTLREHLRDDAAERKAEKDGAKLLPHRQEPPPARPSLPRHCSDTALAGFHHARAYPKVKCATVPKDVRRPRRNRCGRGPCRGRSPATGQVRGRASDRRSSRPRTQFGAAQTYCIPSHSALSAGLSSPSISTVTSVRVRKRPCPLSSIAFSAWRARMRRPVRTGAMKRTRSKP